MYCPRQVTLQQLFNTDWKVMPNPVNFPSQSTETIQTGRFTLVIEFDGGTPCNIPSQGYGIGYGSFQISGGQIHRVDHGRTMSCNAAEVWTLIEALRLIVSNWQPEEIELLIRGDSQNALSQVERGTGQRKPRNFSKASPEFYNACMELYSLVRRFHSVATEWRPRKHSVKLFGH